MERKVDRFFRRMERLGLAVTFGEVRLKTGYSEVLPQAVSLETRFSRRVSLKIPIVSAAMDTVTESPMAIAMAKNGGLGVIHKNLDPHAQREEVRRVKFHLSGRIARPITVTEGMTLEEIENMRRARNFSFHSFPVLDSEGRLVGLITENDFDFCEDWSQRVSEIMTRDLMTAEPGTTIDDAFRRMRQAKKKVLPLVEEDGKLAGLYLFKELKALKSGSRAMYNTDDEGRLRVAAAVGVGEEALERVSLLMGYADVIVVDTAHGDSKGVLETVKILKRDFDIDVVAGNVSEPDSARRLVDAGADGVKVGQGGGSICTTRVVAGVGCPQVTAIYNSAKAIEGSDVPVCGDGGIENSGDFPIALGAGAHSVMIGKLLAGTTEAPGKVILHQGNSVKYYRGMGSLAAMEERRGSRERYLQSSVTSDKLVPEGIESYITYVGDLATVMHQYLGGLRAGMGYVGAATIAELHEKADFHRMSSAGTAESHPHGVDIIRDAPNYSSRSRV